MALDPIVNPISFLAAPSVYQLDNNPTDIYTDYTVHNQYLSNPGLWYLGVTSPEGFQSLSTATVQTSTATLLWVCDWTASKLNNKPNIPSPKPTDANWELLSSFVEPYQIVVAADGRTPLYRISGIYVYGHKNPPQAVLSYGRPPWLQDVFDRTVVTTQLQGKLLDFVASQPTINDLGFITGDPTSTGGLGGGIPTQVPPEPIPITKPLPPGKLE